MDVISAQNIEDSLWISQRFTDNLSLTITAWSLISSTRCQWTGIAHEPCSNLCPCLQKSRSECGSVTGVWRSSLVVEWVTYSANSTLTHSPGVAVWCSHGKSVFRKPNPFRFAMIFSWKLNVLLVSIIIFVSPEYFSLVARSWQFLFGYIIYTCCIIIYTFINVAPETP